MGAHRAAVLAPPARRSGGVERFGRSGPDALGEATGPAQRILQWQRQAGNQAVVRQLAKQRAAVQRAGKPENPPVTTLQPAGTLSAAAWTTAYQAARAKPTVAACEPLFRDIAITAGMTSLGSGFLPSSIPVSDGKTAQPGLNMNLSLSATPGHAGWVRGGKYGVTFALDKTKPPDEGVAIVLTLGALNADKGLSLGVVRHEMVHARHKFKILESVKAWQSLPVRGRPSFHEWVGRQAGKRTGGLAAFEVALIRKGVQGGSADTEVLGYVESFTSTFHRYPAGVATATLAFADLLGAVETSKLYTWREADTTVRDEALARLRDYHATLDPAHRRTWKQWLDQQVGSKNDKFRQDFLTRLGAFVT